MYSGQNLAGSVQTRRQWVWQYALILHFLFPTPIESLGHDNSGKDSHQEPLRHGWLLLELLQKAPLTTL